ncbi:hypothetical protein ACXET9_04215 [Brachybacterium sp. DNPG3]
METTTPLIPMPARPAPRIGSASALRRGHGRAAVRDASGGVRRDADVTALRAR